MERQVEWCSAVTSGCGAEPLVVTPAASGGRAQVRERAQKIRPLIFKLVRMGYLFIIRRSQTHTFAMPGLVAA